MTLIFLFLLGLIISLYKEGIAVTLLLLLAISGAEPLIIIVLPIVIYVILLVIEKVYKLIYASR